MTDGFDADPPLVMGGQGRSSSAVTVDGMIVVSILILCVVVVMAVWLVEKWGSLIGR